MKQSVLITSLMLGAILSAASAEGEWTRKADMPTARFGVSIAEVDGRLIAIGGSDRKNKLYELGGTLPDKHFKWEKKKESAARGNAH